MLGEAIDGAVKLITKFIDITGSLGLDMYDVNGFSAVVCCYLFMDGGQFYPNVNYYCVCPAV